MNVGGLYPQSADTATPEGWNRDPATHSERRYPGTFSPDIDGCSVVVRPSGLCRVRPVGCTQRAADIDVVEPAMELADNVVEDELLGVRQ